MATNPYAAIALKEDENPYASIAVKDQPQAAPPQQINSPGDMLSATGHMLGDLGKGALKGAGSTIANIGHGALNIAGATTAALYPGGGPEAKSIQSTLGKEFDKAHTALEPSNKAQSIGKGAEQVGEFFLPAGAEKAVAAKGAEYLPKIAPLLRIGTGAVSAGLVNKAQGGDFTTGAVTGGATGAVGEGLRSVAPSMMKNALRVGSEGLEYDRNTGKSVLEHTRGVRPGTIARQAQDQVGNWDTELNTRAANAPDADMTPIRQAQDLRIGNAQYRNSPTEQKLLERLREPLHQEFTGGQNTGTPLPAQISPHRLRAIKQGVGSEIGNFSPQNQALGAQYKKAIYGDIDNEFNRVVPGSAELDAKMSSLIPAIKAGQKVETAAPLSSRVLHRIAAHTGAMAGGIGGTMAGYQHGGIPGAVAGGVTGLVLPELAVSPEVQAVAARAMYSPTTARLMRAGLTPAAEHLVQTLRKRNTDTGESK